jgi:uncharacterized membrane protein YfcA
MPALDPQLFHDAFGDPRLPFALGIAALAGAVRGFTGFGSALLYMPLISAIYGPRIAAPTLALVDAICSLPFAIQAMPHCNWQEVKPVTIAGAIALPFGVATLLYVDPLLLRWFIAALVLVAVGILAAGWRYHGKPTLTASLGVGALAGFGAGAVQIGVPPLLVYWLGGQNSATTVRANIMVYFIMQGALTIAAYAYGGLFSTPVLALSLLVGIPFALLLALGARWFRGTSDRLYRVVAYVIVALAGLISLPVFDRFH